MKKMKKVLSAILAGTMIASMGMTAFAALTNNYSDRLDEEPKIPKTYEVRGGIAPAETFKYTFNLKSYTNTEGKTTEYSGGRMMLHIR